MTAPAGTYPNTTEHLFINTSIDTGNFGSDTLTASSAPACIPGQTLANWTVPVGTTANPPDKTGGVPTTKASNVFTATASANLPAKTAIITTGGSNDTTAWSTWGYKNDGQYIQFVVDTSKYSGVFMTFYMKNDGTSVGPTSVVVSYNSGSGFSNILTINDPAITFTAYTIDFSGLTNTAGNTTFRITASGANNDNQGAGLVFDNMKFTGCSIPAPAPTIIKTFLSDPIVKSATSTLSFTISNTATGNQALTGVAFTDVLPAGLSITNSTTSQCGGTLTTTAATRTIALTSGSLLAGGSCTFNVAVTGTTQGQYDNVTGYISSTESGTSTNYATDSLTVIAPPTIVKAFSPSSMLTGGTSTLTFAITNPNQLTGLTGIGFTDTLPSGVTVTGSPTTTCVGSVTTTSSSISFSVGSLAGNATCTISVPVTGTTSGIKDNTTSAVTSAEGGSGNIASATLVVSNPISLIDLNKQISTDGMHWYKSIGVPVGGSVYYRFTVYNGGDVAFNTISVSDLALNPTCSWKDSLGNNFVFPLIPGDTAYCVTGPIAAVSGSHQNTATVTGIYATGIQTSSPSTATYATTGLTIAKSVTETSFTKAGDVLHYSYLVTNSGFAPLLGPVTVADDKSTDEACPAVTTVGDHDNYLDPGESITCTATYVVTAGDVTTGSVTNTASAAMGGVTSNTDSKKVNLAPLFGVTPPLAVNDSASTNYGVPVTLPVLANDAGGQDGTGSLTMLDPATVTLGGVDLDPVTPGVQTIQGSWTVDTTTGEVTFAPADGFYGVVSIPYTVKDDLTPTAQTSNTALITVTVAPPPAAGNPVPPVANNDTATTTLGTPVTLLALDNDVSGFNSSGTPTMLDPATVDLDPSTDGIQSTYPTAKGTWTVNTSTGDVTFTPAPEFTGMATLPYTVQDNSGQTSNEATLTVTVTGGDALIAQPDAGAMKVADPPITLAVLNNDTPSSGAFLDPSTVDLDTGVTGVQNSKDTAEGTWAVDEKGLVTFTPCSEAGVPNTFCTGIFTGTATLPYSVTDTADQTANSTITVVVTPIAVNAVDDTATTPYDTLVTVNAPGNDEAEPGAVLDPATLVLDTDPDTPGYIKGTLLTRLNNSDIRIIILESETSKEVLCPGRRDSMLLEPSTTSSFGGLKNAGS